MNTSKNYIGCEIYIRNDMELYNEFFKNKDAIENSIGSDLEWMELPNATASRILSKHHCNPKIKINGMIILSGVPMKLKVFF